MIPDDVNFAITADEQTATALEAQGWVVWTGFDIVPADAE